MNVRYNANMSRTIYLRLENHWRVWRTTLSTLVSITLFGITLFGIRVGKPDGHYYIAIEVLNFEAMLHL